jgi:hypothetical protein
MCSHTATGPWRGRGRSGLHGNDALNSLFATASRKPASASWALHWRPCLLLWVVIVLPSLEITVRSLAEYFPFVCFA